MKKNRILLAVLLAAGIQALVGCESETSELGPGGQGSGGDSALVQQHDYVGVVSFEHRMLEIADVTVVAESDGKLIFSDTLTNPNQTCWGQDSTLEAKLFALPGFLGFFSPAKHFVFYRLVAEPVKADVVWTVTSVLNENKLALVQDSAVRVSRPWVGFADVEQGIAQGTFSMEGMTIHRKDVEEYFSEPRRTVRTDTLHVSE